DFERREPLGGAEQKARGVLRIKRAQRILQRLALAVTILEGYWRVEVIRFQRELLVERLHVEDSATPQRRDRPLIGDVEEPAPHCRFISASVKRRLTTRGGAPGV